MKTFGKIVSIFSIMMLLIVGTVFAHSTPPTFTPNIASGSEVSVGDAVTFVIQAAEDTAIKSCTYSWNGGDTKSIFDVDSLKGKEGLLNKITFKFETFSGESGTNVLKICAVDEYGNSTGVKEYKYIVKDTQEPTITSNVENNSTVKAGSSVTIEIKDNDYLKSVEYSWNGGELTEILPSDKAYYKYTYKMEKFPNVNDTFILKVKAIDASNNVAIKTFTYNVEYNDTTAPVVEMSEPSGSVLAAGTKLSMTATDEESKIVKLTYNWEGSAVKEVIPAQKEFANVCKVNNLTLGSKAGTYRFHVTAINSVGKETNAVFTYVVKGEETKDEEKPTLSASPASGTIDPASKIVLTAKDNEALKSLTYSWDNASETTKSIGGTEATVNVTAPSTAGGHTLRVTAKDTSDNTAQGIYYYTVVIDTPPTVSLNPSSGTIEPSTKITITAKDNEALKTLEYNWDNETKTTKSISGTKATISVTAPIAAGQHSLKVMVYDASGNKCGIISYYTIVIKDETKPTVSANPSSGTIDPYEKIAVTAKDNEALKSLTYNWNSDSSKTVTVTGTEDTINVTAPSKSGTHTLYVTVKDEAGNQATASFTYKITETDKPSVVADPESGKIEPSSIIELTARDNEALKSLTYNWDSNSSKTVTISGTKDTVNVSAPSGAGKHILYVTVKDASNNSIEEDFVYTIADNEKPTVTVKPNGGEVNAGDTVTITGKDNEGLDKITYNWDDESPVKKSVSGKEATVETEVPNEPGKHTLYVTVEDEDGNKVTDSVDFTVKDDEAPTITVSPKSGSTVKGGKVVKATLKDDVQLKKVTYHWDDDADTTKSISGTSKTIDLPKLPYKKGTYKVKITVEDEAGNVTKGTFTYYVEDDDDEGEYPTVDADPDGGEVEYGDKITITAEDEDGEIEYVEYYWDDDDDDTTKKYKDKFTVKVPSEEGKHYLYVRAMDNDDNLCDYERFIYYVEEDNYPGNSDIVGDINSRVKSLRVEIRNADDKIRFEPDEDILYYVDYYNGTSSKVTNAKLVVDLPTYLEADKASDSGKITTKQVTWSLGTLNAGEYGRVSFVAHYTSSKVNEKIITVPAKIYSGSSLKDTSTVRNLIFCVGASGSGSHQAYCVGYPDGTFLPEGKITRAELASMICNIEGLTYSTNRTTQFTDANDHWAKNYMQTVVDKGYMKPKSYNYFGAQDYATRGDLAYAIAAILDVEDLEPVFISATDTKNSDVRCAMEQLLRLGIMDGYSDGTAKPNSSITRAEAVTIINNYLFRGELYTKGYNYAYNFETNYTHGGNSYILRFTDLSSNHWAYGHIMEATNNHRYERVMDGNEEML